MVIQQTLNTDFDAGYLAKYPTGYWIIIRPDTEFDVQPDTGFLLTLGTVYPSSILGERYNGGGQEGQTVLGGVFQRYHQGFKLYFFSSQGFVFLYFVNRKEI